MVKPAAAGMVPSSRPARDAATGHASVGAREHRDQRSLVSRMERSVYHLMVRFLARRFAWEAMVSRDPNSHDRVYARLLERIDGDMRAEDSGFLRDNPMPRRGHLTIIK